MIIAPDWTTLRGIAAGLDAKNPIVRKKAVERIIKLIGDELPDVGAIRLYDVQDGIAIVRHATDMKEKSANALSNLPLVQQCIKEQQVIWQPDNNHWAQPLVAAGHTVGAMEILVEDLDEDWLTWLDVIVTQMAHAQVLLEMPDSADTPEEEDTTDQRRTSRLVTASRMLLAAEGYDDIATAAMYTVGGNIMAITITIFDQPLSVQGRGADGMASNRRFVGALATRDSIRSMEPDEAVSSLPEQSFVTSLRQEIPLTIDNVETDAGYLSGWMREKAIELGTRQVIAFGLTSNDMVIGTMELYAARKYVLNQEDIDTYASLATQIGNVILGKRLLQQSFEAQRFASQLVSTNKSIAEAEDYVEMAHAVLNDMPEDIETVAIALFNRPFTLMGSPSNLRTEAIVNRQGAIDHDYIDHFSAIDDARVTYFLHEYLEGRMMQLWTIARPRTPVLAQSLIERLQQEEVDVIMSFGLNMSNSLRGLLVLGGREDLRDQSVRMDGLRAIADQLAAVIENRILLEQATDALDLIQSQYEVSSKVFQANSPIDILQAISDFAGGMFARALLVTTELDGVTRIIARIDEQGRRVVSEETDLNDYPANQTLSVLEALEVRDAEEDVFLSEEERTALLADGTRSVVILPILTNFVLSGMVMLTNPMPTRVPPDRLRAMRGLADQVGVVLENAKLLQSTEASLKEIQQLYEANRAMLSTNNNMEVLQTLKTYLATDVTVICQVDVEYDDEESTTPAHLDLSYELTRTDARVLNIDLTPRENEMRDLTRYLQRLQGAVSFAPRYSPVPGNPIRLVQDRYDIASYILIIIRAQERVSTLVMLLFDNERPFVESTRRLYEAIADQVRVAIENQRLLDQSQRTANELAAQVSILQSIGQYATQINAVRDERELLQTGARTLVESLNVDHCGVVLFNDDELTGTVIGEHPQSDMLGSTVSTRNNPVLAPDFDLQDIVIIEDTESVTMQDGIYDDLRRSGIRSIMIVPLVSQEDELIGSVGLDSYTAERHYTANEINTVKTIAAQMVVGLQNIRLLRDSRTRAEQLQRITDFSQTAQSTLNLEQMVDAALDSVPHLLPVSHIAVALYDDGLDELYIAGGWQERDGERHKIPGGETIERSLTTTGYVFETGSYLYLPDIAAAGDVNYPYSSEISTLLAMPLTNRGRPLGVMTIGARQAHAYTDTDIALFQQMVNQMAVAIDNARAYTQSQRIAENKTLANEISVQLQRQSDITSMIDLTMREVGRAIGAKHGRIRLNTRRTDNDSSET